MRSQSLSGIANRYVNLDLPAVVLGRGDGDDRGRRGHRAVRHHLRGRPRPALQHPRRAHRPIAEVGDQGLRALLRRRRPPGQQGLLLPQSLPLNLTSSVRRAQRRPARPRAADRGLGLADRRPGLPLLRHRTAGRKPEPDDGGDRPPRDRARLGDRTAARTSCASSTPPRSTCAPRSTTSTRWSPPRSRSPRSFGPSSATCAASPTTRSRGPDLDRIVRRKGADNDLIELTRLQVPARARSGSAPSPATAASRQGALPGVRPGAAPTRCPSSSSSAPTSPRRRSQAGSTTSATPATRTRSAPSAASPPPSTPSPRRLPPGVPFPDLLDPLTHDRAFQWALQRREPAQRARAPTSAVTPAETDQEYSNRLTYNGAIDCDPDQNPDNEPLPPATP